MPFAWQLHFTATELPSYNVLMDSGTDLKKVSPTVEPWLETWIPKDELGKGSSCGMDTHLISCMLFNQMYK